VITSVSTPPDAMSWASAPSGADAGVVSESAASPYSTVLPRLPSATFSAATSA
jgi:hypothetical protein